MIWRCTDLEGTEHLAASSIGDCAASSRSESSYGVVRSRTKPVSKLVDASGIIVSPKAHERLHVLKRSTEVRMCGSTEVRKDGQYGQYGQD